MKHTITQYLSHPRIPGMCIAITVLSLAFLIPLNASLWLDELLSAWVSAASFADTIQRANTYQGQSPLYFLILHAIQSFFPTSELALRSVSLVAALFVLWLTYILGRQLALHPSGAACAVLFLLASSDFQKFALSARPYMLALLCTLLAVFFLLLWSRSQVQRYMYLSILAQSIAIYFHPVFFLTTIILFCLLIIFTDRYTDLWKPIVSSMLLLLLCIAPLVPQLYSLSKRQLQLSFAFVPTGTIFFKTLFPLFPVIAFITAFVCSAIFFKSFRFDVTALKSKPTLLFIIWFATAPILFYLHAAITDSSLFLSRIMFWRLPGLALFSGALVSACQPTIVRSMILLLLSTLTMTGYAARPWHVEDWRGTHALLLEQEGYNTTTPLVFYSGLIETDDLSFLQQAEHHAYLTSPLSYYGNTSSPILLIPGALHTQTAHRYLMNNVLNKIDDEAFFITLRMRKKSSQETYVVHEKFFALISDHFEVTAIRTDNLVQLYRLKRLPTIEPL